MDFIVLVIVASHNMYYGPTVRLRCECICQFSVSFHVRNE